jgi:hypothetical protein
VNVKNPLLITVVAFALAAFGFYHFGLSPKRKEADDTKAKVTEAQSKLDAARQLLASNQAARENYKSDYSTVVRLGKAVPGDDDVRSLVVQLDNAAKKTHVDFQSIQVGDATGAAAAAAAVGATAPTGATLPPGATVGPAGFPVMPFSFSFRGGFFRLGAFFQRLDAFVKANNDKIAVTGRLLTVDGVKLEPDTTGFPNIKATVQATSYLVSPLEGATGGATPAGPAGTAPSTTAEGGSSVPTTTATSTGAIR